MDTRKTLNCSSKGNKKYSPFYAEVSVAGHIDTIENHWLRAHLFEDYSLQIVRPKSRKELKAMKTIRPMGLGYHEIPNLEIPIHTENGGGAVMLPSKQFELAFLESLWLKYFDTHPELVEYARTFQNWVDPFQGHFPTGAPTCLRILITQGRPALYKRIKHFVDAVNLAKSL